MLVIVLIMLCCTESACSVMITQLKLSLQANEEEKWENIKKSGLFLLALMPILIFVTTVW